MTSTDPGRDFMRIEGEKRGKAIITHEAEIGDSELVDLGKGVKVPPHQGRVHFAQARQSKYYQKEQGGTLTGVFSSGTRVDIDVVPQGIGKVDMVVLEMTVVSTSGNIVIPPAPLLINYLEIRPNQGGQTVGKEYGDNIYHALLSLNPFQLDTLKDEYGVDGDFLGKKTITTTATELHIPLLGSWMSQCDIHMAAEFKKQIRFEFTFASNAIESGTAANLSITDMKLRFFYHSIDMSRELYYQQRATNGLHHMYIDYSIHKEVKVLTAGADNDFELSGIVGKCHWLFFAIRGSAPSGTAPFRGGLHYYYPWEQFEFKDSGGKNLLGGNPRTWKTQKNMEWSRYFPSGHKWAKNHNLGILNFAEDPEYSMNTAAITGAHRFTGNEHLVIKPSGTAIVPTVLAYAIQHSGTSAPSAPDGGTWYFQWRDPATGRMSRSTELAFDITPTDFQTAVYAMDSWDARGVITLNQTPNLNTSFTLTFGGVYLDYPPTQTNVKIVSFLENNTIGHKVVYNSGGSTAGVAGFTTGSYELLVYGYHSAMFEYLDQGNGVVEVVPHKE